MITVYTFWNANVNVCYVWLIASHLKCDVIVYYVWLGWLHFIWNVMWLCVLFSLQDIIVCYVWLCWLYLIWSVMWLYIMFDWIDCISFELWYEQLMEDANVMAAKRSVHFILNVNVHKEPKCTFQTYPQSITEYMQRVKTIVDELVMLKLTYWQWRSCFKDPRWPWGRLQGSLLRSPCSWKPCHVWWVTQKTHQLWGSSKVWSIKEVKYLQHACFCQPRIKTLLQSTQKLTTKSSISTTNYQQKSPTLFTIYGLLPLTLFQFPFSTTSPLYW